MNGYEMREQRRLFEYDTGEVRDRRKKAMHHDKHKDRQQPLCKEIILGAATFAERRANELTSEKISTVGGCKLTGRRAQDKESLQKQITNKDRKSSRLIRKKLDISALTEIARKTKPTNNATFVFNRTVLLWQEKVDEMAKVKFWATLTSKTSFKATWCMAQKCLIHLDANPISKWMKGTPHGPVIQKRDGSNGVTIRNKEGVDRETYASIGKKLDKDGREVHLQWNYFDWGDVGYNLYKKTPIYRGITSYSKANEFIS